MGLHVYITHHYHLQIDRGREYILHQAEERRPVHKGGFATPEEFQDTARFGWRKGKSAVDAGSRAIGGLFFKNR